MSRSNRAWTKAPFSTVRGARERARPDDQARLERRFVVIATSVLVTGVTPAAARAGSAGGLHSKPPTTHLNHQSANVHHAGALVLARGAGYSTRDGAAPVRSLQRRLASAGYTP